MRMKNFILVMVLCVMPLYGFGDNSEGLTMKGTWGELEFDTFSLVSKYPISGKVLNGLLILTNERPDRPIVVTLTDSQGSIIIRKEFPQENTSYMVIPLDGLQEGETYIVTLTSPYPVDCLTAFVNLKKSYSYETR